MIQKNITKEHIIQAIEKIERDGIHNTKRLSTKYLLDYDGKTYPPKYVISIANEFANNEYLGHDKFIATEARRFLEKLGFSITTIETEKINETIFDLYVNKYNNAIKETDWLRVNEIYKFNFLNWIDNNIDFENDSKGDIKRKTELSQEQKYTDDSNEKGINFITTIKRFNEDFITIEDIDKIKNIIRNPNDLDAESVKMSFGSYSKTSVYLSLFSPDDFVIYDNDTISAYGIFNPNKNKYPKKGFKAFEYHQSFCKEIKEKLKNSSLDKNEIQNILNVEELNEKQWNFLVQDFLFYVSRDNMGITSIDDLVIALNQKQEENNYKDFHIDFDLKNRHPIHYNWFSETNSIKKAEKKCHYEIYFERGSIYLDIHFEDDNTNENYYSNLKDAIPNEKVNWFKWYKSKWGGKNASKSLRHNTSFKFEENNLVENIYNALKDLVEVGKLVAKVACQKKYWILIANSKHHDYNTIINENNIYDWALRAIHDSNPILGDEVLIYETKNSEILAIGQIISDVRMKQHNKATLGRSPKSDSIMHPYVEIKINKKLSLKVSEESINKYELSRINSHKEIAQSDFIKLIPNIMKNNHPHNQILFGPPGTGKTYKTKELAVSIIDGETPTTRPELSARYDELIESKQIQFTTFHQSMSYEDFVEGLKPILTKEDEKIDVGDIGYEIKNGIFKDMCLNAESFKEYSASTNQFNLKEDDFEDKNIFKISLGNTLKATGNKVYEYCRDNQYITLGWGGDIDYSDVTNKKEIINKYTDNTGLIPSSSDFNIRAINHFKLNMQIGDLVFVSHGNKLLKAVGKIVGEYEYDKNPLKGYYHYRKVEWFFTDIKIPVTKVYEKEFSQQSIYEMQTDKINIPFLTESETIKKLENTNNVVLIIDEINRGNVSAIFGELITLIEEDKRKGKDEEIEVVLPYSKEPFTVPDNLYIIGTMNTADRSVEALDSALRRRFSFEEVAPNPEVLQEDTVEHKGIVDDIDLVKLLQAINSRIELLLDKDHKIGHSYFFKLDGLKDLKRVFKDKIIPLLEEYFYGDFGKIGLILGSDFVKKTEKEISFVSDFTKDYEDSEMLQERLIYTITPETNWSNESFQKIYGK